MRALSLTQPWLNSILHLGKRIENRTAWKGCAYRGPILLHAAKSVGTRVEFDDTIEAILQILGKECLSALDPLQVELDPRQGRYWRALSTMQRGGIVGRARITGVLRGGELPYDWTELGGEAQRRWWFGGFALVLADVEPLPFVPWRGELGLFEVPDDYATRAAA